MKVPAGMLLLPFLFGRSRGREKIDSRLLQKTRTLKDAKLQAIVFSKQNDEKVCKVCLENKGIKIKHELPLINAYAVELESAELEEMARSDIVEYISDDVKMTSLLNVAAQEVGARIANDTGYTGKGVGIAILDTGIYPHQDLVRPRNRIVAFKDIINNWQTPYDDNGHGTFVAGVAAGNGYLSGGKYKGVAPDATLIGVKVMNERGSGDSSDIIAGMQWVADNKDKYNIKVLSVSLGAQPGRIARIDPLAVAVEAIWDKGIIVVAAAGNSGPRPNTITTPGISSKIITVGAVDDKRTIEYDDDTIADFSSRGPVNRRLIKPDLVAPGVNVTSTNTNKDYKGTRLEQMGEPYRSMSGTSVATPIVSGAAAIMLEMNAEIGPDEIKGAMKKNTFNMKTSEYAQGSGILNISSMIK
ncbi:MAG TPA: S8 family peptidase [Bacillota bacterium]|nr:S8 family peptidase [Bacillota bacterium]